jgi:hypothetical protein
MRRVAHPSLQEPPWVAYLLRFSKGGPPFALSCPTGAAKSYGYRIRDERRLKTIFWEKLVRPERFELPTFWFVARRSDPAELRAHSFKILPQRRATTHRTARQSRHHRHTIISTADSNAAPLLGTAVLHSSCYIGIK